MAGVTCANCSQELKPSAQFCGRCGTPVAAPGEVVAVVPATAPAPAYIPAAASSAAAPALGTPGRRRLIYVGAGLAALVLVIVAGVVIGTSIRSAQQSSTSSDSAGDSSGGDVEEIEAPSVVETLAPSPAASVAAPTPTIGFQSMSGNIRCVMAVDGLVCQQGEIKYAKPSQACAGGPAGVVIGVTETGVTWPCLPTDVPVATVLAYDQPITNYGITCAINYDRGITCTNTGGNGFTMEYEQGVRTF